ncbi:MAG: hypothetical protein PF795_02380 [Kiritimatiellae bacterium]|nr:hypothetical protein [Kiritimatiellia bacterium]
MTQVRAHLERLRELEYIAARYGRPGSAFQYELLIDPQTDGGTDRVGLLDPEKLRACPASGGVRCEPVGENGNLSGGVSGHAPTG